MKLNAEQVVVVTGGASGIGLACVLAFIEAGCKVVVADLNEEAGQRLAKQHQQVRFFKTNVVDEENVKQLIEFTVREFGKVTVALNCAGIATAGISI
jgi:NAD(P)-dependent dehydrogenase (short-subunit alcohol dehydrogenase family)